MNDIPAGYKQTEVGVIPEEWVLCRLDSLGAGAVPPIKAGPFGSSLTKDTYVPTGYKVYGQEQVIRGDYLYGDYFISLSKYRELESCAVSPGDVLLSLVGTAGKLLVVPDNAPPGVINPRLIRFSFDKKRVCPQFFKELFGTGKMQSFLARYAQGGTMGVLNAGMLRPVSVPLPPLPEQRAIAGALSDVDALIGTLDRLIAKKRDLKQAAMQQLLTGQTRLPGFNGEWKNCLLSDVATPSKGKGIRKSEVMADGLPCIRYGEIYTHHQDYIRAFYSFVPPEIAKLSQGLQKGDLCFAGSGETAEEIGKCVAFLSDEEAYAGGDIVIFRPIGQNSMYFGYLMNHASIAEQKARMGQGDAIVHVSARNLSQLQLRLPIYPEQTAITAVLSDMDVEIATLEARRDKTRALKQGMMQELLTGRTRLL